MIFFFFALWVLYTIFAFHLSSLFIFLVFTWSSCHSHIFSKYHINIKKIVCQQAYRILKYACVAQLEIDTHWRMVYFFTTVGCRASSVSANDDGENLSQEKLAQKKSSLQLDQENSTEMLGVPSFPAAASPQRQGGRNKVALKPGRSLMDWVRFANGATDVQGFRGKINVVTPEELGKHCTEDDCWVAIRGELHLWCVSPFGTICTI